jgi:hypothetical protein
MMNLKLLTTLTAVIALPITAGAQLGVPPTQAVPAPFMHHTYEEKDGGWQAVGTSGKLSITHDPVHVKEGKGALQYDYKVAKGEMSTLYLPTPDGALAKAKAIRFWLMTDYAAPLYIVLQEHDGGRYVSLISTPKYKWQQVELAPSDFTLSEDNNDPPDPNNRLDMDKVESIGIVDLGQFLAQADEGLSKLFVIQKGDRALYLDDFRISEETLPNAFSAVNMDVKIDTLVRPQLSWLGVGDTKLTQATGKPLEGKSLQLDYHQAPGQISAIMHRIPRGKFAGTTRITFNAASTKPVRLLVQVEEKGGGKYNSIVEIRGARAAQEVVVNFADMKAADDSKDTNDHLDIDQIVQIVFIDLTGQLDSTDVDNTLWINDLRAGVAK